MNEAKARPKVIWSPQLLTRDFTLVWWGQMVSQVIGVVSYGAWAFLCGLALFTLIKKTIGLRVSKEEELKGLDITEHGNDAYAGFQIFTNQ